MQTLKQTGFTVVELVLLIVLVGILSASALPTFFDRDTFSQRAFFDDTLTALRYAQKLAVVTHCDVQVAFSANSYTLKRPAVLSDCGMPGISFTQAVVNPATGGASYTGSEADVNLVATDSNSGAALSAVVFYALGDASVDATVSVAGKIIKVVKNTGFVYAQ